MGTTSTPMPISTQLMGVSRSVRRAFAEEAPLRKAARPSVTARANAPRMETRAHRPPTTMAPTPR
jgi:hypothetical protein